MARGDYLLARQPSELERLRLQAIVWKPTGRQLLSKLGDGSGMRALDVGSGALGWLRILSEWVGPSGHVVGADIDQNMLAADPFMRLLVASWLPRTRWTIAALGVNAIIELALF